MNSPYAWLPHKAQIVASCILLVATIFWMRHLSQPASTTTPMLQNGVVSLDAPWSSDRASANIEAIGSERVRDVRINTGLGFVFLILCLLTISLGCALAAGGFSDKSQLYGFIASGARSLRFRSTRRRR